MSDFKYSVSLIVPSGMLEAGRRLSWALGHDSPPLSTFSAPLSADGTEPATHYGAHTYALQSFVDILTDAQQGKLPPIQWSTYDLTEQAVRDLVDAMTINMAEGSVEDTWPQAMSEAGVQRVESEVVRPGAVRQAGIGDD